MTQNEKEKNRRIQFVKKNIQTIFRVIFPKGINKRKSKKDCSTFCCDTCSGIAGGVGFIVGVGLLSWGGATSGFSKVFGQTKVTIIACF